MERSEQVGELVSALAKAQSEFHPAVKDSENPYYNSKYADLATVISATRPALTKHGIAVTHSCASDIERQVAIVTTVLHCGEQWIASTAEAPAVGKAKDGGIRFDAQTIGAAWTYLRRYTLQGLLGIASEDDDGNALVTEKAPPPAQQKKDATGSPLSAAEAAAQKNWSEQLAECRDFSEFEAVVWPSVKDGKVFLKVMTLGMMKDLFRLLSTVEQFNKIIPHLNAAAAMVRKQFIAAASEEAAKRGYGGDRTTGLYVERKAS